MSTRDDKKFVGRTDPSIGIEIVDAKGSILISSTGKKYIDFVMGWCVGNIGWGNQEIRNSLKKFNGPTYVAPTFIYKPKSDLAALLAKITPGDLKVSFRATGGTEAVEIALQAASAYTGKSKFISIEHSYHGDSVGAMSIGSSTFQKHAKGLLFRSYKIKSPFNNKAADQVEKLLQRQDVAALIMEPIVCALSVEIPEQIFMSRIEQLCKKYNALLIMDEVATGFGRTGKLFATQHFNIKPDIMCLAKGISGGYGAIGATIMTEKIAKAFGPDSSYYSTYGWHPLSIEAALANLKYFLNHRQEIESNTQLMSNYFRERFLQMNFKHPAEIRIKGLAIGLKFTENNYAQKIVEKARDQGVLISSLTGQDLILFPALNIDLKTAKKGLDIIEKCL